MRNDQQAAARSLGSSDGTPLERCKDYARIEAALAWLAGERDRHPTLDEAAAAAGMSAFHFQRMFTRWAGVSPKQFLQHLSLGDARQRLAAGANVLEAALDAGFSGPSRLHDALVRVDAVTPGEFRSGLAGVTVHYGYHPSPFGEALLMVTPRGLCGLGFVAVGGREEAFDDLARRMPNADLRHDPARTAETARSVFREPGSQARPLRLYLNGTRFQVQVWRALLSLPPGALCSYGDLARSIGAPRAARAVGSAVGANPIAYLIPCHRVIKKSGHLGGYHWGSARKLALIGCEAPRAAVV